MFEDVVSPALISASALMEHVSVHFADVLRPSWADTLKSQVFPIGFGTPDIGGFPSEHEICNVLVVAGGAECPTELEGQEVDHVWNARVVEFPLWSAKELGPLEWEGGSELFSKLVARPVPEVDEANVHDGSDIA